MNCRSVIDISINLLELFYPPPTVTTVFSMFTDNNTILWIYYRIQVGFTYPCNLDNIIIQLNVPKLIVLINLEPKAFNYYVRLFMLAFEGVLIRTRFCECVADILCSLVEWEPFPNILNREIYSITYSYHFAHSFKSVNSKYEPCLCYTHSSTFIFLLFRLLNCKL